MAIKKMRKSVSEHIHFKRQTRLRYGIEINRRDRLQIEQLIKTGRSIPVVRKTNTKTTHLVVFKGRPLLVGYNTKRNTVVTGLQVDNWKRYKSDVAELQKRGCYVSPEFVTLLGLDETLQKETR